LASSPDGVVGSSGRRHAASWSRTRGTRLTCEIAQHDDIVGEVAGGGDPGEIDRATVDLHMVDVDTRTGPRSSMASWRFLRTRNSCSNEGMTRARTQHIAGQPRARCVSATCESSLSGCRTLVRDPAGHLRETLRNPLVVSALQASQELGHDKIPLRAAGSRGRWRLALLRQGGILPSRPLQRRFA
jgi:hypothetical protein